MLYWLLKLLILGPTLRLLFRPTITGAHHIPADGPVILASNHLAVADSIFLPLMVKRRITFVAKREYFTGTGLRGRFNRWFYTGTGQVPIDRDGSSEDALATAVQILDAGGVWGIYPEGSRSPDGRLHRGKTGAMRVAARSGAPVIPVAMHGTDVINPIGSRRWRLGRVNITVGEAINVSNYCTAPDDRAGIRAATDAMMSNLQALSRQEYIDEYAPRVRAPGTKP